MKSRLFVSPASILTLMSLPVQDLPPDSLAAVKRKVKSFACMQCGSARYLLNPALQGRGHREKPNKAIIIHLTGYLLTNIYLSKSA